MEGMSSQMTFNNSHDETHITIISTIRIPLGLPPVYIPETGYNKQRATWQLRCTAR